MRGSTITLAALLASTRLFCGMIASSDFDPFTSVAPVTDSAVPFGLTAALSGTRQIDTGPGLTPNGNVLAFAAQLGTMTSTILVPLTLDSGWRVSDLPVAAPAPALLRNAMAPVMALWTNVETNSPVNGEAVPVAVDPASSEILKLEPGAVLVVVAGLACMAWAHLSRKVQL